MLNGKISQPRRKLLHEHQGNQGHSEPTDESSKLLRRNVRHQQPPADYADKGGRNHLQNQAPSSVLVVDADGKNICKNQHRKNGPRRFPSRKHTRHHKDSEHSQSAETRFRHADANRGEDGENPAHGCEFVHYLPPSGSGCRQG